MKICGIIAEYNPFHNGHKYHIDKTKEKCDAVVAIISSNFVQRGEPALCNKFSRAKMALKNGVDLVLELPVYYSCQSAEIFARGAVETLNAMGVVNFLSFGVEDKTQKLTQIVDIITQNNQEYVENLKIQLKKGLSYPQARAKALHEYSEILAKPNNILAIEYLKALKNIKSQISPIYIERNGAFHDSTETFEKFASASMIRNLILQEKDYKDFVPQNVYEILQNEIKEGKAPVTLKNLKDAVLMTFRSGIYNNICDVTEGLENRLREMALKARDLDEFIELVKTKRYTHSRIRRICINTLLNIQDGYKKPEYIRVLGANKKGFEILRQAKEVTNLPIITKTGSFNNSLFNIEKRAGDIYSLLYKNKNMRMGNEDLLTSPVIIK